MNGLVPRLGVLGWPVGHSRSPAMQQAALAHCGLTGWTYQHLPVPPPLFDETVRGLPGAGFLGVNVTIPYKHAALALADVLAPAARAIGAANTLTFADGIIQGENTDAPGLIAALPEPPAGRTALVLGAGGTARAAVWALLDAGAAEVLVWNRTPERAERLCAELGASVARGPLRGADLLVNCTSVGLPGTAAGDGALPVDPGAYATVADFVYGPSGGTALARAARVAGAHVIDGLELLVCQGALSFARWTGRVPDLAVMRAAARGGA